MTGLKQNHEKALAENASLLEEKKQLTKELNLIRQTAANAIDIEEQRNQLQERVVNLERELLKLQRDKQALEDSTSQRWFMIGGGVVILGIIIGLILPRIPRRKRTHYLDSFEIS